MGVRLEPRYFVDCDLCGREATSICSATQRGAEDVAKLAGFQRRGAGNEGWVCPFCALTLAATESQGEHHEQ